jgi:nucleotide-binding universal stress UspA family protein
MRTARAAARAAGVALEVAQPPVLPAVTAASRRPDVEALVMGARGTPGGRRPGGHTVMDIATHADRPLAVVPPVAQPLERIRRVLVGIDGDPSTAAALEATIEDAERQGVEVVVLHVHEDARVPAFEDHPHHEHEAWSREFLRRWDPGRGRDARLELRSGLPGRLLIEAAKDTGADLIALAWSQRLSQGRASVVREALSSSPVPVLLVPVAPAPPGERRPA